MLARRKFLLSVLLVGPVGLWLAGCTSPDTTTAGTASPAAAAQGTTSQGAASPGAAAQSPSQQAAPPAFSPAAGTYPGATTVTITTTTAGASIRYTTDGSTPTESAGTEYAEPVSVTKTETMIAIAFKTGWTDSTLATAAYKITGTAAMPAFSLRAGTYSSDQSVAISCATQGAAIHFTTDGSTPTSSSAAYAAPVPVSGNGARVTLKAMATGAGIADSPVASVEYAIDYSLVSTPNFSPDDGTYPADQSVTISCATSGAVIHYTTDNSTPSASSPEYAAPIVIAGNGTTTTIKAYAMKAGMTASEIAAASFVISFPRAATPAFSPRGGIYPGGQKVAITCDTSEAAVYYTTDGSVPTAASTLYSSPIPLAGNGLSRTIRAVATGTGMSASLTATSTYTTYDEWQMIGTQGRGARQFNFPAGVAVDARGRIYVADSGNSRIVRMDDMSGAGWAAFGSPGSGASQFNSPLGIAVDAGGHIFVADLNNSRIVRIDDMTGTGWTSFGSPGAGNNRFVNPAAVAVDAGGHIYVADSGNSRIVRMDDMNGAGWTAFGTRGSGAGGFNGSQGIVVDAGGHIFIADYGSSRIVRMDDMGGGGWTAFGAPGTGAGRFKFPARRCSGFQRSDLCRGHGKQQTRAHG